MYFLVSFKDGTTLAYSETHLPLLTLKKQAYKINCTHTENS